MRPALKMLDENGRVAVQWHAEPGVVYQVEGSDDLEPWDSVASIPSAIKNCMYLKSLNSRVPLKFA
jgi:hypothetical protein